MEKKTNYLYIILAIIALLFVVGIISLSFGSINLSPLKVLKIIFFGEDVKQSLNVIIKQIRLPRIILSFLVGAGLSIAGVVFQGVIRNPMVDPYIVGISAGAGTGVTLAIVLNLQISFLFFNTIPLMAFFGSLITVYIVYNLAKTKDKVPVVTFLLAGVAVGFVLNAVMSFFMVIGTRDLSKIVYWLLGSLSTASWQDIRLMLPYFVVGNFIIIFFLKDLNLILLGERDAQHLGVDVEKSKRYLIIGASLVTASVVSVSGSIGFIGLIVPHIARMLVGPDHKKLFPTAAILGGIFLIVSDDLARILLAPMEIPVGIITALTGGPYFIYLLRKQKKEIW
ncbi:MAG TPA: iron chelate uptake ABC transporter family permease subunit [Halanaerobiales bacterium]|nr:iron chelate uptake ABC transporter family permease subunit [Halanaerobiales bacterium]